MMPKQSVSDDAHVTNGKKYNLIWLTPESIWLGQGGGGGGGGGGAGLGVKQGINF